MTVIYNPSAALSPATPVTASTITAATTIAAGTTISSVNAVFSTFVRITPVAVASLPSAAGAGAGAQAIVNDALAPTFGSAVAGGGAVVVGVTSNGTVWNVG